MALGCIPRRREEFRLPHGSAIAPCPRGSRSCAHLLLHSSDEASRISLSSDSLPDPRRALAQVLAPRGEVKPWMRLAGSIGDAGPEASQTVDTVVYGRERP